MSGIRRVERYSSDYCMELSHTQWDTLCAEAGHESQDVEQLKKAGCHNIYWSGHFGRMLYFTADEATKSAAIAAVKKFVKTLSR